MGEEYQSLLHWEDYVEKTRPGNAENLTRKELRFYYDYFSEIRPHLIGRKQSMMDTALSRMEQLRDELTGLASQDRHSESRKLTRWAIAIAAIGAVATVVFGIVGVLQKSGDKQTSTPAPSPSGIQLPTSPLPRTSPSKTTPTATATTAAGVATPRLSPTPAP